MLDGANYLGAGPTFPTATKQFECFPGLDYLQALAGEIRLPAFAIGGINQGNIDRVVATGIGRVAVSAAIAQAADPGAAARDFGTARTMNYEVEQKFPVDDLAAVGAALTALGAEIAPPRLERDVYYTHPGRDFAHTDEALRIRRVGHDCGPTYKGPKIDATTKSAPGTGIALGGGPGGRMGGTAGALGFRPLAEVRKQRRRAA